MQLVNTSTKYTFRLRRLICSFAELIRVRKMGSGVRYRRRRNRYIKIGIIAFISLATLYLIFKWTSGSSESFHYQMFSQRRPTQEPYLVDGKLSFLRSFLVLLIYC